jgi:hypothetical protein
MGTIATKPVSPPTATELHLTVRRGEETFTVDLKSKDSDALTDEKLGEYFALMAIAIGFDPRAVTERMAERYGL